MKEDAEPEAPQELEQDSKPERRTLLGQEVHIEIRDCTLNVIPTLGGRVLTPLTDGGLQYLVAGARANVGVRKGRYLFEVKIVETLNPFEPANSRGSRVPRQLVRMGFSTQDSSLFLGETEESVCFDSEGFFTADKKRSQTSERFSREQTLAVLLNLERRSPNADTVSLFRNGVRISQPQPLPENLLDKALFPHVNFKNVTLQVNFGPSPLVALPFTCRTWQEVAKDDTELRRPQPNRDGKFEVLFPVGLPDEGTFDWLDGFLQKNPHFTEISDRQILKWAERSGLWRPNPSAWKNSNDKPDMNFGIPMMDDSSVRRVLNSVISSQPRNYVVMEVKANLMLEERQDLMRRFYQPFYKKVAVIVVGEPTEEFKSKAQESMLREKQVALEQDRLRKRVERERKKAAMKEANKDVIVMDLEAEVEKKEAEPVKEEVKKEAAADDEPKAKEEVKEEGVKKEEDEEGKPPVKKEEDDEDKTPTAELTPEEQLMWFRKKPVSDLTSWVLSTNFTKFTLPEREEGFDEIRYMWQEADECKEYLKAYILKNKVQCRIEDLQPSDWFRTKWSDWQKLLQEWHTKLSEYKISKVAADKAAEDAKRAEAREKAGDPSSAPAEESKEEEVAGEDKGEIVDIMKVEDVCDVGKGEPLFANFEFEDWALLSLRLELHLLVHGFRRDVTDPERLGIYEQHLSFYYNKYYRKSFNVKYYGIDTNFLLVDMVKETISINPKNQVLEAHLDPELGFGHFVKLTEEARRERQRRLDAGDETVKLKFSKPEVPPLKGTAPQPQAIGGQAKGAGKAYYTPRPTAYTGAKGGSSYCWGGYGGPSAPPAGGTNKGYSGQKPGFKEGAGFKELHGGRVKLVGQVGGLRAAK